MSKFFYILRLTAFADPWCTDDGDLHFGERRFFPSDAADRVAGHTSTR